MDIDYDGKIFRSVGNTANGEANDDTFFYYHQQGNIVTANYLGGSILYGNLIAKVGKAGKLDMRYQHLNRNQEFMTGQCISTPEVMENGKLRMHESWQWTCKDHSSGNSIVEEI